jgi:hypothetical protein
MIFYRQLRFAFLLFWCISFLLIVTIFKTYVHGQSNQTFNSELNSIKERAKWRLGPFRIYPTLQLSAGYDNNIFGTYKQLGPVSDFVATVSPQLTIYLPFRNWFILSLFESPQYVYFAETENERALNNSYSLAFRMLVFNRFSLSGAYESAKTKERISSEIDRRIFGQIDGYSGSIFLETARSTSIGFSGYLRQFRYENVTLSGSVTPISREFNRDERNIRMEFYYRLFADSSFFMNFGYTNYTFIDPEARFRDSYSYQFYTGIQFPLLGRTRGTLSLGYKKFVPQDESLKAYYGLVGNTSLYFRLGRFGLRLQYIKDVPFSYEYNNIYFIDNRVGAGISLYLSQSIRLDYGFSYGEGNYPEEFLIQLADGALEEIKRIDVYRYHSVGIVFRIFRNTGIGLTANYWERLSNYFLYSEDRFFLGALLTYAF